MSSPMRVIGRPQSSSGQSVESGSWRGSTRRKCSGNAWRRGLRGGGFGLASTAVAAASLRSCSNWARKLASSSTIVSSNRRRWSAFTASSAGTELPALEARQLERDLLDLGIAPGDVAVLALQQVPGLTQLAVAIDERLVTQGEKLFGVLPTGDLGRRRGRECLQVERGKIVRAEHDRMVLGHWPAAHRSKHNCIDAGAVVHQRR